MGKFEKNDMSQVDMSDIDFDKAKDELEEVDETVQITWLRPTGTKIVTNSRKETIEYALSLNWERIS